MDRVIKFRAWNTRRKEMEYIDDLYWFEENGVHSVEDNNGYKLMQYTGLKDIEGKEIYEDDNIVFGDYKGTIIFSKGSFMIQDEDEITNDVYIYLLGDIHIKMNDGIRVVGNIYERID